MNKAIAILIAISLSGCYSQNKLAKVCSERFPIKEEIKEVLVINTILTQGDTIYKLIRDTLVPVVCPPSKTITKTKEVKITAENTAKTHLLNQDHQKEINKLNDECDKQIKSLNAELKNKTKEIDNLSEKLESVKKFKRRFYLLLSGIILYFVIRFGISKILSSL
jgi:predicted RNase H-like nuclease (RuvC/YqgF family)